jgi:hypothetical protein
MSGRGWHLLWDDIALESWRADAACVGEDPRLWEPYEKPLSDYDLHRWGEAVRICATCPVRMECARDAKALDGGSVRGGMLVSHTGELKPVPRAAVRQPVGRPRDTSPVVCGTARSKRLHQRHHESCPECRTGQFGRQKIGEEWPVVSPNTVDKPRKRVAS